MRVLLALAMCGALLSAPATAQTQPDPVITHFRAYRAALEREDFAVASQEAELALVASETADGDGGRTAILALNLATTRLLRNDAAGAIAPAQRAHTLAEAGAQGVNTTLTSLILGRAELATSGRAGADRLTATLAAGDALDNAPAEEIYPAAAALGAWWMQNERHDRARDAWDVAARYASGSIYGEQYGLASARLWEAASIITQELRRRERMNEDNAAEAYMLLAESYLLLQPMALVDAPGLELTVAQNTYANVLAWSAIIRTKMRADDQDLPTWPAEAQGDADGMSELGFATDSAAPRCLIRLHPEPPPQFPRDELERSQLGVVVTRLEFDAGGHVVRNTVVARAGSDGFQRAVERVANRWHVTRRGDSPANCRMPRTLLSPISFMIE